jgi:hypothetical protein
VFTKIGAVYLVTPCKLIVYHKPRTKQPGSMGLDLGKVYLVGAHEAHDPQVVAR